MNTELKSSLRALVAQIEHVLEHESPLVAYLQSVSTRISFAEFGAPRSADNNESDNGKTEATYWQLNHSVVVADIQYDKGTKFLTTGRAVEFHVPKVLAYPEEKRVVEDLAAIIDTLNPGDTFWFKGSEIWYSQVINGPGVTKFHLGGSKNTALWEHGYYVFNEEKRESVSLIFKPAEYQYTGDGDSEELEAPYVAVTVHGEPGQLFTAVPEALREVVDAIAAAEACRTK